MKVNERKCVECGRRFDLLNTVDADEWFVGHDCEDTEETGELVTITGVRPFGLFDSIIVFDGLDENGLAVTLAVDHRLARAVREALYQALEFPDQDDLISGVEVMVEPWQVIGRYSPLEPAWVQAVKASPVAATLLRSAAEEQADRMNGRES